MASAAEAKHRKALMVAIKWGSRTDRETFENGRRGTDCAGHAHDRSECHLCNPLPIGYDSYFLTVEDDNSRKKLLEDKYLSPADFTAHYTVYTIEMHLSRHRRMWEWCRQVYDQFPECMQARAGLDGNDGWGATREWDWSRNMNPFDSTVVALGSPTDGLPSLPDTVVIEVPWKVQRLAAGARVILMQCRSGERSPLDTSGQFLLPRDATLLLFQHVTYWNVFALYPAYAKQTSAMAFADQSVLIRVSDITKILTDGDLERARERDCADAISVQIALADLAEERRRQEETALMSREAGEAAAAAKTAAEAAERAAAAAAVAAAAASSDAGFADGATRRRHRPRSFSLGRTTSELTLPQAPGRAPLHRFRSTRGLLGGARAHGRRQRSMSMYAEPPGSVVDEMPALLERVAAANRLHRKK